MMRCWAIFVAVGDISPVDNGAAKKGTRGDEDNINDARSSSTGGEKNVTVGG